MNFIAASARHEQLQEAKLYANHIDTRLRSGKALTFQDLEGLTKLANGVLNRLLAVRCQAERLYEEAEVKWQGPND